MEREIALKELKKLEGQDLRPLADKYGITVWKDGKPNKGWAGHVMERYLGLPINSSRSPNFGSWELKQGSLKRLKSGEIKVKETLQITMIDAVHVLANPFEQSHLLTKLKKGVLCVRMFESDSERAILMKVATFDLDHPDIYAQVKADYEEVRETIRTKGFKALTGAMGILVQPRTKGPGHGSTSRAFYARTGYVAKILGMEIKESV
jgi:DNA mismatch repair protein MutH